jgi:hypothetical protein
MTDCAHCWHYKTGWTDGLAMAGHDIYVCCRCGKDEDRDWHTKIDHAHGPFAPDSVRWVRIYRDGRRRGETS